MVGESCIYVCVQAKIGLVEELEDLNKTKAMKERQLRSQVEGLEEELRVEREEGNKIANVSEGLGGWGTGEGVGEIGVNVGLGGCKVGE